MTIQITILAAIVSSLYLTGCGGGSAAEEPRPGDPILVADPVLPIIDDSTQIPDLFAPISDPLTPKPEVIEPEGEKVSNDKATYRVTMQNMWSAEDYPQGFPDDAHLSLIGGATHNVAVSFWEMGESASVGIEDMAETGRIDKLLFNEVMPAITNGTADSTIEIREYTDAMKEGVPGELSFEIQMDVNWPLVSLVTMLGPSPDWFVGVSGLSLFNEGAWETQLSVELPLLDGGTKSDMTPTMGGPDVIPQDPIGLLAYYPATGVYLQSDEPQNMARLIFEKIETQKEAL